MIALTYYNLISCGVHIGHTVLSTLFLSSWMLYNIRQNICIINLFKTVYMFRISFKILKNIILKNNPIWFINLDRVYEHVLRANAMRCGEFYISNYWKNGMITNFNAVNKTFKYFSKKFLKRQSLKNFFFFENWVSTRFTGPRLVFVTNILRGYSIVTEAFNFGIYCLGIVDTNIKSQSICLAVPGNDESLDSLVFYNELICNYILLGKFKSVILGFSNIRNYLNFNVSSKRLNLITYKPNIGNLYLNYYASIDNIFTFGSNLVFGRRGWEVINFDYYKFLSKFDRFRTNNHIGELFLQNMRFFFLISKGYILKYTVRKQENFIIHGEKVRGNIIGLNFFSNHFGNHESNNFIAKKIKFNGRFYLNYLNRYFRNKTYSYAMGFRNLGGAYFLYRSYFSHSILKKKFTNDNIVITKDDNKKYEKYTQFEYEEGQEIQDRKKRQFGNRNQNRFGNRNQNRFGNRNQNRFGNRNQNRFGNRNQNRFGYKDQQWFFKNIISIEGYIKKLKYESYLKRLYGSTRCLVLYRTKAMNWGKGELEKVYVSKRFGDFSLQRRKLKKKFLFYRKPRGGDRKFVNPLYFEFIFKFYKHILLNYLSFPFLKFKNLEHKNKELLNLKKNHDGIFSSSIYRKEFNMYNLLIIGLLEAEKKCKIKAKIGMGTFRRLYDIFLWEKLTKDFVICLPEDNGLCLDRKFYKDYDYWFNLFVSNCTIFEQILFYRWKQIIYNK